MRDTIFTRKLDELGRIVLPIELRQALALSTGDEIALAMAQGARIILLQKSRPSCLSCQQEESLKRLPNGTYVCEDCLQKLS